MAVPNTYTPAQYNCNGSTVAFPFTFGVGATSEIEVILTDANGVETILTETTHYTVSAVNNDYESGGTVTTVATYASGNKITLRINVPLTQDADFVEGAPTLYESFENGLDKLTRIAQQLSEGRERTLIVPKTELASISREIPDAATRASKLLGFDASGEPVAVTEVEGITLTSFGNALVSSDDAAEARTILEAVLDEDDFASNSTDQAPSQQSAKAYVDGHILDEDDMASDSAVLPPSQQSVRAYVDGLVISGMMFVKDQKAQNTSGGAFTQGAWRTRDLNTVVSNTITGASLASNQITLPAGTYIVNASAPAVYINNHVTRLQNITAGTTALKGTSEYASNAQNAFTRSFISGKIILAGATVLELQHNCTTTHATGFGIPTNLDVETYSQVSIIKIGA